jgi:hypothetical protein
LQLPDTGTRRTTSHGLEILQMRHLIAAVMVFTVTTAFALPVSVSIVKSNAPNRVSLALSHMTDSIVAGQNVYYGGVSGAYTNKINAGTNLAVTLTNLPSWSTYYFAATTYTAPGAESQKSAETAVYLSGVLFVKWSGMTNKSFTVQSAPWPTGPWTNLTTTTNNTWSVTPAASRQFFRVRGN